MLRLFDISAPGLQAIQATSAFFPVRLNSRIAGRCTQSLIVALTLLLGLLAGSPARAQGVFAGQTAVGVAAPAQLVTIPVVQSGTVSSIQVLAQGSSGYDFSASAGGTCSTGIAYPAGQSCTVNVTFKPVYPGQRLGAVALLDASGKTLGSAVLSGSALGAIGALVPGTIYTIAGDNAWLYAGDGAASNATSIFLPFGIAVDAVGNMYIADSANARIRKVIYRAGPSLPGTMSTIGGNGLIGSGGDGGPATSASLNNPVSVALDGAGNVYFTDSGNNAIRRIDAFSHQISTVAGTLGVSGYSGDGGPATAATLNAPSGITFDAAGNLYIADTNNNVIRKVVIATGVITTIVGNGRAGYSGDNGPAAKAQLNGPWSVTLSPTNQMYIADQQNNCVRLVDTTGTITTAFGSGYAGFSGDGGPASQAGLKEPANVVIDVIGNIYIADSGNNVVRKVNGQTGIISTIAGNLTESYTGDGSAATNAGIYGPYTLALDGWGNLYITDVFHNRIREISTNTATLNYTPIREGRVSPADYQVFENDGNAPLTVNSVTAGANALVDAGSTGCTPGRVLNTLDQCIVGADFAPTVTGTPVTGTVSLDSTAVNAPSTILLTGNVLSVDPASVTLTSSENPSTLGDAVTFQAAVVGGQVTPTGAVTLYDGATALAAQNLNTNALVNFKLSTLSGGTHNLTASYAGDSNNSSGVSPVLVQVVKFIQAPTTTTLSTSANPVDGGAPLHLAVTVVATNSGSGNGAVTGTVTFTEGTTPLGSATVANGLANFTLATLPVGTHMIVATYSGSSAYQGSASPPLAQQVRLATTQTALTAAANPLTGATGTTLTATLTGSGGTPTGVVTFFDGNNPLGTAPLAAGVATFVLPPAALAVGTHPLTASYGGDALDAPSTSPALAEVVLTAPTTALLTASANPAAQGSSITFTAQIASKGTVISGPVTFFDGATSLGSGSVNTTGAAVLAVSNLALGTHTITAVYAGDNFDSGSTSPALSESILQGTATALVSSNPNESAGSALTLTAVVTGANGLPVTGTVRFLDGSTLLGSAPVNGSGTALYQTSTLGLGQHTLTAVYSGDAADLASTSKPQLETVSIATSTTTLQASANPTFTGAPLTLSATVTSSGGAPTGLVTFFDGANSLGSMPVTAASGPAATATLSLNNLTPGLHSITASYAGDPFDAASVSAPLAEEIEQQTVLTLSSSENPAYLEDTVTITATATGGVPNSPATGSVTLMDGGAAVATQTLTDTGVALFTLKSPALGQHTLTATYTGDAKDSPATAPAYLLNVTLRPTTNTFTASLPNLSAGQNVIFTSVVVGSGPTPPTGTVSFVSNGTVLGTAPLSSNGVATLVLSPTAAINWNVVAQYPGDGLYAPSNSAPAAVTVGPTAEFTMTATPAVISMQSGNNTTLTLTVTSAPTFSDTLALGCAGLPVDATCTFSKSQIVVSGGGTQTLSLVVDTGHPLGSGATASSLAGEPLPPGMPVSLAFMLPGGTLLGLVLWRTRRQSRYLGGLLLLLFALGVSTLLTGCANSLNQNTTPAGAYSFRIIGTGTNSGATQFGVVNLTVTQ
jgi:hypothetical protein